MLSTSEWIDYLVKGLIGAICIQGVHILSQMKASIDSLNEKVAKIIERTEWHSKEIEKLEHRIVRLEERGTQK